MGDANTFAERLRMLRSKKQSSQETVAAFVGCSQNAIGTWERGESSPQVRELAKLCEFYEVSSDYLVGLKDQPSGMVPNSWVIDLDYVDGVRRGDGSHLRFGDQGAFAVPVRMRIVSSVEYQALERELRPLLRKFKGKEGLP